MIRRSLHAVFPVLFADPSPPPVITPRDVAMQELSDTRFEILDAEKQVEVASFRLAMLRAREARLSKMVSGAATTKLHSINEGLV